MNKSKSDFKLIAIRPLKGCDIKYLKVLTEGEIYKFYKDYKFILDDENNTHSIVKDIKYTSTTPNNLYSSDLNNLKINVSAIVGKNGSGKSTLIELLFVALYNFSIDKGIIRKFNNRILKIEKGVNVEFYYDINNVIYIFKINTLSEPYNSSISVAKYEDEKDIRTIKIINILKDEIELINQLFFYTISVNYSHHSLNSEQLGKWVKPLFHKNDSYQTPIVVNPMRTKGIFDINTENNLVKQRLLSNILEPTSSTKGSLRELSTNKIVKKIKLKFDRTKIDYYKEQNSKVNNGNNCVAILYKKYTNLAINQSVHPEPDLIETEIYVLFKLVKICKTYSRYKKFFKKNEFIDIEKFTNKIINDSSHITFKVKQALNFLRHKLYVDWKNKKELIIDIEEYSTHIKDIKEEFKGLTTIELIPPSIFEIEMLFEDGSSLDDMSSGEKQKIHSVTSIIYHLININSVFENGDKQEKEEQEGDKMYKYKYINIVFDEVELYFHPELQRKFIKSLLDSIKKIDNKLIRYFECLNIQFLTHSPFILSDIPNANVLFLEVDESTKKSISKNYNTLTFGANIHKMLIDNFFIKNTIGDFALDKINDVVEFYNKVNNIDISKIEELKSLYQVKQKEFNFIANNIGENYIGGILKNNINFIEKKLGFYDIEKEIQEKEKELNLLKRRKNVKN
jgi:energy-coupling factor transporter ATP-binding protein EcfA2